MSSPSPLRTTDNITSISLRTDWSLTLGPADFEALSGPSIADSFRQASGDPYLVIDSEPSGADLTDVENDREIDRPPSTNAVRRALQRLVR